MSEDDFKRLIFSAVLSFQYHPRNEVKPDDDEVVIERCLDITEQAAAAFNDRFMIVPF